MGLGQFCPWVPAGTPCSPFGCGPCGPLGCGPYWRGGPPPFCTPNGPCGPCGPGAGPTDLPLGPYIPNGSSTRQCGSGVCPPSPNGPVFKSLCGPCGPFKGPMCNPCPPYITAPPLSGCPPCV